MTRLLKKKLGWITYFDKILNIIKAVQIPSSANLGVYWIPQLYMFPVLDGQSLVIQIALLGPHVWGVEPLRCILVTI